MDCQVFYTRLLLIQLVHDLHSQEYQFGEVTNLKITRAYYLLVK